MNKFANKTNQKANNSKLTYSLSLNKLWRMRFLVRFVQLKVENGLTWFW